MKFYDHSLEDYKLEEKNLQAYCSGIDFSEFEYCEMSMQHLNYIDTYNGVHVYHNFGTCTYHFGTDEYSIKPVKIGGNNSVLFEITDLENYNFKVWFDLDVSDPEEITGDWNKYIFFTNNSLDNKIKEFQEDSDNFEECLEKSIELYEKKALEKIETIRNSIRQENISYNEIAVLSSLKHYIPEDDVELLQWIKTE